MTLDVPIIHDMHAKENFKCEISCIIKKVANEGTVPVNSVLYIVDKN
jgi:hypothetical protein